MKTILTLLLFLATYAHAGKTYNVTIQVFSAATLEPLAGIIIRDNLKKVWVEVGKTNNKGEFIYTGLKDKYFSCDALDPNGIYEAKYLSESNEDKIDITVQLFMLWNETIEIEKFAEIDAKYPYTAKPIVDQAGIKIPSEQEKSEENFIDAKFKDGPADLMRYIAMNVDFPYECLQKKIQGKVYVTFLIEPDGTVTHVEVEKGVHPALDKEAVRVIRYMPKWNPASKEGQPARVRVKLPIVFNLN